MEEPVGYVLCDDLIFTSRITGTAKTLGLKVKPARSAEALQILVSQQPPSCVIVDLANPGLKLSDLIHFLTETSSTRPRIIAFGSHVDAATLRAAREAGCDPVLPRSKFVEDLPRALPEWLTPPSHQETI
jgi:CheY-like chemotaxis protein